MPQDEFAPLAAGASRLSVASPPVDEFEEIVEEILELHDKKAKDYGSGEDPLANIRASQGFGIAPWIGAVLRANDKVTRIKSFVLKGNLVNESVEDSLLDAAVYFIIALQLFREQKKEGK